MGQMEKYDVAIIGAGMSGLAAGIRLAHFGKKVCIFERHYAPGGLNSFYAIRGRKFDVGLHAMTNFVPAEVKKAPLPRILRQLRISREDLNLSEQKSSRTAFPGIDLRFSNDFELLRSEVERVFPKEIDRFNALVRAIESYDDTILDAPYESAREVVAGHLKDPVLVDMIFCPLMYYGSATEDDMDFSQFVVMFKSIFLEGFARPLEGIRNIIQLLLKRYREVGGIRKMKTGVAKIVSDGKRAIRLVLDSGDEVKAESVLSSAGVAETFRMCQPGLEAEPLKRAGRLGFCETINIFEEQPEEFGWGEDTIVFFNDSERFEFRESKDLVDLRSGVICIPNNFDYEEGQLPEGIVRLTSLANYDQWTSYSPEDYIVKKNEWRTRIWDSAKRFMPETEISEEHNALERDMFTPKTIERYTWHANGAIYGAPQKLKDGRTPLENLFICGTDQGFLGIIGSMLSGITIANTHLLR
ncbi:MAG: NAD(P)/FAD-dependent oxidoreductase [Verrucomicrobiota bacterium]